MQGPAWVEVLQRIPAILHDKLMLIIGTGTEINLQQVVRTDNHCLAIRRRLAASTEGGRLFFVPYDQIQVIGFREAVNDAMIAEIFGGAPAPAKPELVPEPVLNGESAPGIPSLSSLESTPEGLRSAAASTLTPAKAALLERLRRARANANQAGPAMK